MKEESYKDEAGLTWKIKDCEQHPGEGCSLFIPPSGIPQHVTRDDCDALFWFFVDRGRAWETGVEFPTMNSKETR